MIAYAKAGINRPPTAPEDEQSGANQDLYVEAPLDMMWKYFYRAQRQCKRIPFAQRFEGLRRRDEEERMR